MPHRLAEVLPLERDCELVDGHNHPLCPAADYMETPDAEETEAGRQRYLLAWRIVSSLWCLNFQKIKSTNKNLNTNSVCVASLVRIYTIAKMGHNIDITWAIGDAMIWSNVEPCIGIVSACLPTLRPVLRRFNILWCFSSSHSHDRQPGQTGSTPIPSGRRGYRRGGAGKFSNQSVNLQSIKTTFRPDDDEAYLTTDVGREERDQLTTGSTTSGNDGNLGDITVNSSFHWSVMNVERK